VDKKGYQEEIKILREHMHYLERTVQEKDATLFQKDKEIHDLTKAVSGMKDELRAVKSANQAYSLRE